MARRRLPVIRRASKAFRRNCRGAEGQSRAGVSRLALATMVNAASSHVADRDDMHNGAAGGDIGCEVGARAHEFLNRAHRALFIFRIILFCLLKVFQRWGHRRTGGDRRTAALPYPTQMVDAVGSAGT